MHIFFAPFRALLSFSIYLIEFHLLTKSDSSLFFLILQPEFGKYSVILNFYLLFLFFTYANEKIQSCYSCSP